MDAKFNDKTCLGYQTYKLGYQKTQNFIPSSNSLKKIQKSPTKKSYKPKTSMLRS